MSTKTSQNGTQKFKAKKFRVATEGATTDGRNIERSWIEQMAASYDRKIYGARVWMEHLRGTYPDSTFRAYGDVISLEAREVEGGKLALFAEIEPLPDLVAMTTKAKQKIFTSIEVNPKFTDTGKAYLTGLAVTDSPASLGTEILTFAQQKPAASPFAHRKTAPECLFSEGVEQEMAFEPETSAEPDGFVAHFKSLVAKFTGKSKTDDERFGAVQEAMDAAAEQFGKQGTAIDDNAKSLKALEAKFADVQKDLVEVKKTLDTTDPKQHSQRPPATGGTGAQQTDC